MPLRLAALLLVAVIVACGGEKESGTSSPTSPTTPTQPSTHATLDVRFCGADAPAWVAYQDEAGAWTQTTLDASRTAHVPMGVRGGVAAVTGSATTGFALSIAYAARAELATAFSCSADLGPITKTWTGTTSGVAADEIALVSLGSQTATVTTANTYSLRAPAGAADLVAVRFGFDITTNTILTRSMIVRRGLQPADGAVLPLIDFGAAEAIVPTTAKVTVGGVGADIGQVASVLITKGGTFATMSLVPLTNPVLSVLPASAQIAGDLHGVVISAAPNTTSNVLRGITAYFAGAADQAFTLGSTPPTPAVSVVGGANPVRLRAVASRQADYPNFAIAAFDQAIGSLHQAVRILTSASYDAAGAQWDVSIPDLSPAGFQTAWGLRAGTRVSWSMDTYGGSAVSQTTAATSGTMFRNGHVSGTITP